MKESQVATRTGDNGRSPPKRRFCHSSTTLATFSQKNGAAIVTLNTLAPSLDEAFPG